MRQRLLLLLVGLVDLNDSGMAGHMESRLCVIRVPVPSASFPKRGGAIISRGSLLHHCS